MHRYPSTALTLTSSLQATKIPKSASVNLELKHCNFQEKKQLMFLWPMSIPADFCQGQHKEITASKKQTVNLHRTDLLPKLTMPWHDQSVTVLQEEPQGNLKKI